MNVVFIIGIFISWFQFVLLLNKKSKSLPDKILTFWMLVIGIHLLSYFLHYQGYWAKYPHLVGLTAPFPLIYGPLLFLYVSYSLKGNKKLNNKEYWHFLPVTLAYLYMSRFYFFYSAEQKRMVDNGELNDFDTFSNIMLLGFVISGLSYSVMAYRMLREHQILLNNNFSNTEGINLNWLRSFIWGVGLMFATGIIVEVTSSSMGMIYPFNHDLIFYSMLVFAILTLGYFGIRHQNIFVDNLVTESPESAKASYRKSGLKEDLAAVKYNGLLDLMRDEKPYLEPKLTLNNLAESLDISPNYLSQIINQYGDQNFNDFVNKYRVEEFINKAAEDKYKHLSYLAIALESGFNSKSTFNAVFKKQKGLPPSQYMSSQSRQVP